MKTMRDGVLVAIALQRTLKEVIRVRTRTFDVLKQMSLKGSQQRPLIFEIEDLHWIDQTSEDFLSSLVESVVDASILLLITYRPGYRPRGLRNPMLRNSPCGIWYLKMRSLLSTRPVSRTHCRSIWNRWS